MRHIVWFVAFALLATAMPQTASAGNHTETHGEMKNHAPKVIQVEGMPERVMPLAGGQREVTFEFMAQDPNGWQDIERAEVSLFAPDNSTFMRDADVTGVTGGDGASHWFNATFVMWYYEMPTTDGYILSIRVVDKQGAWSNTRYVDFEYMELAAIQIATGSGEEAGGESGEENGTQDPGLAFGGAEPGEESDTSEVVIRNTGNVAIDLELYGTDLVNEDGHAIPVSSLRYSDDGTMENESALGRDPTLLALHLEAGIDSTADLYWRLRVPTGDEQYVPAGTYSGSITINGVSS